MYAGCKVDQEFYKVGDVIKSKSSACLECICHEGGLMECNPLHCKAELPLLLRMNSKFPQLQSTNSTEMHSNNASHSFSGTRSTLNNSNSTRLPIFGGLASLFRTSFQS